MPIEPPDKQQQAIARQHGHSGGCRMLRQCQHASTNRKNRSAKVAGQLVSFPSDVLSLPAFHLIQGFRLLFRELKTESDSSENTEGQRQPGSRNIESERTQTSGQKEKATAEAEFNCCPSPTSMPRKGCCVCSQSGMLPILKQTADCRRLAGRKEWTSASNRETPALR